MIFVDLALATRIERASMAIESEFARAYSGVRPDVSTRTLAIADGAAVFAGLGTPMSQATGLGLAGEVTRQDIDDLVAFYEGRGARARVVVCPMASGSLTLHLGEAGFRLVDFEQVMIRDLTASTSDHGGTPGVEVRTLSADEVNLYIEVVGPNFSETGTLTPEHADLMRGIAGMPGALMFVAEVEGRPAGGGVLLVRDGIAMLAGAGTLPEFRRRGVHACLLAARLAAASARGCDFAVMGAAPGSDSQKNAERRGFRLAYTKANLEKT